MAEETTSSSSSPGRMSMLRANLRAALNSWGEENIHHEIKLSLINACFSEEGPSQAELEEIFRDKVSFTILYRSLFVSASVFTSFTLFQLSPQELMEDFCHHAVRNRDISRVHCYIWLAIIKASPGKFRNSKDTMQKLL